MINANIITNYMKENKLTKAQFAKECKIAASTLNKVLNNENVKVVTLFKITRKMNIYLKDIFSD